MASQLPLEILLQIADILVTEDRLSCALTCKKWRYPFQETIWKDVIINSNTDYVNICNTLEGSKVGSSSHGQSVRSLSMSQICLIPNDGQDKLLKSLPNLKHLDLGRTRRKDINKRMTIHNDVWKSLESLKVQVTYSKTPDSTEQFIKLLENCSKLQSLEIFKSGVFQPVMFTQEDFDSLHQKVQLLSSFKACISLDRNLDPRQESMASNIVPIVGLTNLELQMCEWSSLWAYYFGHKYPNLRYLSWSTVNAQYWLIAPHTTQPISEILDLNTNIFQHLETLEFVTADASERGHADFWDFFLPLSVPIKHLKYKTNCGNNVEMYFRTVIKRFLRSFSETLETITVEGSLFYTGGLTPRLNLPSYCPMLVDLEVKSCGVSIDLNNLFDNCVALERLKFYSGELLFHSSLLNREQRPNLEQRQKQREKQHGLRILELHEVAASADTFSDISFRCRRLEYMSLDTTFICGTVPKRDPCLLLDMTYTSFKALHLAHVKFCSYYDNSLQQKMSLSYLCLSQSNNPQSSEVSYGFQPLAVFHIFPDGEYDMDYTIGLKKLSKRQFGTTVEYFENRRFRRFGSELKPDRRSNRKICEEDRLLQENLSKGYVELRCNYVAKYTTPELAPSVKEFWKDLYNRVYKKEKV
ncbi:hypothetical protein J3Q64DRAFT_1739429, partial [Phycomyces blakesleeanus]